MLGLSGTGAVVNLFTFGGNGLLCERINGVDGFLTFDPSGNTVQSLSPTQSVNYSHLVTGFGSQLVGGSTSDAYDGLGAQWGYRRESGNLFLLGHRYYSSQRGQFLTRDPIGYGGGVNLYGYTANDPINLIDPLGTDWADNAIMAASVTMGGIQGGIDGGALGFVGGTLVEPGGGTFVGTAGGVYGGTALGAAGGAVVGGVAIAFRHYIMNMASGEGSGSGSSGSGQPEDVPDKDTNNWSAKFKNEGAARQFCKQKLGRNPTRFGPNKLRSQNGKWQYRAKPNDVKDNHVHLEELDPVTGRVKQNLHLRW